MGTTLRGGGGGGGCYRESSSPNLLMHFPQLPLHEFLVWGEIVMTILLRVLGDL